MATASYRIAVLFSFFLLPFTTSCWNNKNSDQGKCRAKDIGLYQSPSGFTGLHVPKFSVQIVNESSEKDGVFDVVITCEDFASTNLVNPMIFRRVEQGCCLVKNGKRLKPGEVISFVYSNLFSYNFRVLSVKC